MHKKLDLIGLAAIYPVMTGGHLNKWRTIGFSQNYKTQFLAKAEELFNIYPQLKLWSINLQCANNKVIELYLKSDKFIKLRRLSFSADPN